MTAYPGGHAGYLVVAFATHAMVGYALGAVFFDRPLVGAVGGVVADADFLFPAAMEWPFVHRGITHGLLVLGAASALATARSRSAGGALAVAYASHLFVDSTTPMGVPLLYPLLPGSVQLDVGLTGHAALPTALLWVCCLGAVWLRRR